MAEHHFDIVSDLHSLADQLCGCTSFPMSEAICRDAADTIESQRVSLRKFQEAVTLLKLCYTVWDKDMDDYDMNEAMYQAKDYLKSIGELE